MQELRKKCLAHLGDNIEVLFSLLDKSDEAPARLQFHQLIQSLNESACTQGCPEVNAITQKIENLCHPQIPTNTNTRAHIKDLLHSLTVIIKTCAAYDAKLFRTLCEPAAIPDVHHEALRELDKEKSRLSLSLHATGTGLWEWDLSEAQTHYDENWCMLLGYQYPLKEVERSWSHLLHPEDYPAAFLKLMALVNQASVYYQSEHRKRNGNGGWDWVLETGKAVEHDAEGKPVRIMGTLQIINERKAMELHSLMLQDQLNKAARMEAIGQLTAGIAHDFNNILGAILGYAELAQVLLNKGKDIPADKITKFLGMIHTSGTRAKELITQMHAFSRLTPERQEDPEPEVPITLLEPVVKQVVSLLRSSLPSTVSLEFRIDDKYLQARIQPVHLHQIILNLGINARDAIGAYGKIEVILSKSTDPDCVCASCNQGFNGEFAKLTVQDSGSGIPAPILNKIFDPFFTTKETGKGTGMGLSVVHGLVHALGGHIQIESDSETGSAISVLLPLDTTQQGTDHIDHIMEQAPPEKTGGMLNGLKIMVIDDERGMTAMLHEFLSLHGARPTSFNVPQDALNAFEHFPDAVDLIITDETMPSMDLAKQILKLRPDMPIILCAGYSENTSIEAAENAGIAGFFHKPMNMNELLKKIQDIRQNKHD